jgi:hypothetical protein
MAEAAKKSGKRELKKYITPVFRLSFPHLFVAQKMSDDDNSTPKFGCQAVWTPSKFTAREKELWRAILQGLDDESKRAFKKAWKDLPANFKKGLRNGNEKDGLEGYGEGTRFASLTSKMRPGVIDVRKDESGEYIKISPEEGNADEIYPGCYCRATVTIYSYDNKGKGVAIGLRNIQKVKDGKRLDSRVDANEDFDEDVDAAWLDESDESGDTSGDDEDFE